MQKEIGQFVSVCKWSAGERYWYKGIPEAPEVLQSPIDQPKEHRQSKGSLRAL